MDRLVVIYTSDIKHLNWKQKEKKKTDLILRNLIDRVNIITQKKKATEIAK